MLAMNLLSFSLLLNISWVVHSKSNITTVGATAQNTTATRSKITTRKYLKQRHLASRSSAIPTITCREGENEIPLGMAGNVIRLVVSSSGTLCTLTLRESSNGVIIPVGRSYDNHPWEAAAGPFRSLAYNCNNNNECEVTLPKSNSNFSKFFLTGSEHGLSRRDETARFFEQASFGVTTADLMEMENKLNQNSNNSNNNHSDDLLPFFATWTYDQIYKQGLTSHRKFWRERTLPLYRGKGRHGRAKLPCEEGSYWRGFAFTEEDLYKDLVIDMTTDGRYALSIDGQFRSTVTTFKFKGGYVPETYPVSFLICVVEPVTFGDFRLLLNDDCTKLESGNPPVATGGIVPQPATIEATTMLESVIREQRIEKMTLKLSESFVRSSICDLTTGQPIFVKIHNGDFIQTMIYEPRLALRENYVSSPLNDGGGSVMKEKGGGAVQCSNVAKTFLNEKHCRLSTDKSTCAPAEFIDGSVKLSPENIKLFYEEKWRYVYAVTQLRLNDDNKVESPCAHGARSRWKSYNPSEACNQNVHDDTAAIFRRLIRQSNDSNPHVTDVSLASSDRCHWDDRATTHEIVVSIGNDCWKTVHPDYLNVYDFSEWTVDHPGNTKDTNPIMQFALEGSHLLQYPESHLMARWNRYDFPLLGRLGDEVNFRNFPDTLRSPGIANLFGLVTTSTTEGRKSVVCGSPFEAKSKLFPSSFSITRSPRYDVGKPHVFVQQRRTVWFNIVASAPDQLRQRVAWALSQLLVVSPSAIMFPIVTETFLNYYDIFVKHGLSGNYRDILQEVAYSPMMAEMLSYLGSRSKEYIWKEHREIQFADENFAREIMQLFSIGLIKLNMDGTAQLDSNGNTIATYNNDDITEYARVWTGFRRQNQRGNTEERGVNVNSIDPMAIQIEWRDQFPKMGLDGSYIGDKYPICSEMPADSFLKKTAKYRLIGKAKQSDIQKIPDDLTIPTLDKTSILFGKLCKRNKNDNCSYPGVVYLEENLPCSGVECNLSNPQIVHIGDNVHYEYIEPPCIHFPLSKISNMNVAIDPSGRIAIERGNTLQENFLSLTYFRVEWKDGNFPSINNDCGNGVCQESFGFCRCQITVEEARAFSSMPSRNEVLSQLHIGGMVPDMYSYADRDDQPNFTVYTRNKNQLFGRHSTFEIKDDFGRTLFLKNMKSSVIILEWGKTSSSRFQFRNAPTFYDGNPDVKDAQYETDAALDHYFYHQNTAPFLALRLIQRFGISNPSPRFLQTVAQAFKTGHYEIPDSLALPRFGSGEYGDLAATVAAILLDRESRNVVLDADPSSGGMREPILKIMSMIRSMNYVQTSVDYLSLHNLKSIIGQSPHDLPSVFSFFLPEYAPPGVVAKASLVAPEAMVMHNSIGLLNGMFSLVDNGLNSCAGGFGGQLSCWKEISYGHLAYADDNNKDDADKVVDNLATLLTSGRLSNYHRDMVKDVYSKEDDKSEALRLAQKMMILSAEYHVDHSAIHATSKRRPELPSPTKSCKEYKAVVHIMLKGGCDSMNLLVPHSQCRENKDMYDEYKTVRGSIALSKEELLRINTSKSQQICEVFGIHPHLPLIKELYEKEEAVFLAGIGVLSEPVAKNNYEIKTKTQLFAHNTIQTEISRLDPHMIASGTGTLGRLADELSSEYSVNTFSVDTSLVALEGKQNNVPKTAVNSEIGFHKFNPSALEEDVINSQFGSINSEQEPHSSFFGQTWSSSLHESATHSNRLHDAQRSVQTSSVYPDTNIGHQLQIVSKVIASHECRGSDRDIFYVETGSYDHHSNVVDGLKDEFDELNEGLASFVNEMKELPGNAWDKITVVVSSDFGRTLSANSGGGTDHGWSGNTFMLGGSINGGRILGKYPDDLTSNNPLDIGRGRLIPTMPFESPWNAVIQWLGVTEPHALEKVLPNSKAFPNSLLQRDDLFATKAWSRAVQCDGEGEIVTCTPHNDDDNILTDDNPATDDNMAFDDNLATDDNIGTDDDNFATDDNLAIDDNLATDDKLTADDNMAIDDKLTADDNMAIDDNAAADDNLYTDDNVAYDDFVFYDDRAGNLVTDEKADEKVDEKADDSLGKGHRIVLIVSTIIPILMIAATGIIGFVNRKKRNNEGYKYFNDGDVDETFEISDTELGIDEVVETNSINLLYDQNDISFDPFNIKDASRLEDVS